MQHRVLRSMLLALACATTACGTDSMTSAEPGVAGDYHATTLTISKGDSTIDELAQGISLSLRLAPDGSIAGQFTVVDVEGKLGALDLHGSWTQDDSTVTVQDNANAIAGFMPLRIVGTQLAGESMVGAITAHLVLSR